MKIRYLSILLLSFSSLHAQYYYNDIIGTMESNRQMKTFLDNKVRMVSATGYDPQGTKASNFAEVQEIKENGKALKVTSNINGNYTAYYNRFDAGNRLISIADSSTAVQSVTTYEYDSIGRIVTIQNTIRDSANDFNQTEVHYWMYNTNGSPQRMWRTINGSDSLEVRFTPDEESNAGEERSYKRGMESAAVYYYYDDKKRMTDVVRYNTKYKRLMPDIMFEYDDNNRVIQKITTTSSASMGYLIWRYVYDAKGLKTKEALFNDEKQLTGKIEYSYNFNQ